MGEYNLIKQVAKAYNNLDYLLFVDLLAEDFTYESQHVLEPMVGKDKFLHYIKGKFETIKRTNFPVNAEIGYMGSQAEAPIQIWSIEEDQPCIIMSQGDKEDKSALIVFEIDNGKIKRMDLCIVPHWSQAKRTYEYPT